MIEDQRILSIEEIQVTDVSNVVAGVGELYQDTRRQVGVEQKPHAGRAIGTSRSLTTAAANSSAARMSARSRYG